ncbi:MAG: family 20 glycosylhydrolase [Clostridia bacterium]|nr:family 20 glycosylhydrolase [Clostridia bacterium]
MKELVKRVLGLDFGFEIAEVESSGVFVSFDGKSAKVGGCSKPALARAYMLLAKAVSEGKESVHIEQSAHFDTCGVMLDMSFGSVTHVAGVKKYLDYMAIFGMNMLMLYTEDTYVLEGYPLFGYQRGRYTLSELREIDDYAFSLGIEVIPCIQTFGHLGKFLRYNQYKHIAENDRVLLPGEEETYKFIEACIATCRKAFRSDRIHIGCDETHGLGLGKSFVRDGLRDRFTVFNEHVTRVFEICKKYEYTPMMWSDMYSSLANKAGKAYDLSTDVPQEVIDKMPDAEMVFWNYYKTDNEFYRGHLIKHLKFGKPVHFAGGIWTWNGQAPNISWTYLTVKPALEECLDLGVRSVFAAAWAYGDINHIQALPCLAIYSEYCWRGMECTKDDIDSVAEFVTEMPAELCDAISDFYCGERGDINIGKLMIWGDPLIFLLPYGYDFDKIAEHFENSLKVFEKYPGAPYVDFYKALFRCALGKTRGYRTLSEKYKAGDREWLENYKDVSLPALIKDYELLYTLHDKYWHEECKTHGFEKLGNAYAAATERLRFTRREIEKYLDGKIERIEALEEEIIEGEPTRFLDAARVMATY